MAKKASNPLQKAIASGVRMNDIIGDAFARVGTREHPEGFVIVQYRETIDAISQVLDVSDNPLPSVSSLLKGLRASVRDGVRSEMFDMISAGQDEAIRQLSFYGEIATPFDVMELSEEVNAASDAIAAIIDTQTAIAQSLIITKESKEQIVGSDERVGVIRYSDVTALAASFIASFVWDGFAGLLDYYTSFGGQVDFQKQAVAALDGRTTDCCLRVHGQVQNFWTPFELKGTPRYADFMQYPAFHGYCRTAVVLYNKAYDNGVTQELERSAQVILNERKAGGTGDRHPANAYS